MKHTLIFIILAFFSSVVVADGRPKIHTLLNKEILITDFFSGQSITLIKEANEYFIIRTFFGSGHPVIASLKYPVTFYSDYQIRFSKVINGERKYFEKDVEENFILNIMEKGQIELFLNGIQVITGKL